jgi:PAS domain S-box-containing protein
MVSSAGPIVEWPRSILLKSPPRVQDPLTPRPPFWASLGLLPKITHRFVASFVVPAVIFTAIAAAIAVVAAGHFLRANADDNLKALAFATAASQGAYTIDAAYLQSIAESIVKAPHIAAVHIVAPGVDPIDVHSQMSGPITETVTAGPSLHQITLDIPSPIPGPRPESIGKITIVANYDGVETLSGWLGALNAFGMTAISGALIVLSLLFVRRTALNPLAAFAQFISASSDDHVAPEANETEVDALFRFSRGKMEALAASEQRLSTLIANVPGVVYRYRGSIEHGRLEYVSPAVETLLGYSVGEVLVTEIRNMRLPWLSPHSEQNLNADDLRRQYKSGEPVRRIFRTTTKSGQERWLALSSRAVDEPPREGEFIVEGVAIDVTEQHNKEQELADAVTREFKLQAQLAETHRNEALGLLAGGIAHDFNNILGAARAFGDLITQETEPGSRPNSFAHKIVKACDRAADVVRQILLFTRASDAAREAIPVMTLLTELETLLGGRLPIHTNLIIRRDVSSLSVVANGGQLIQVFLNLAINASDALEGRPGTVSIDVDTAAPAKDANLVFEKGFSPASGTKAFFYATGALHRDLDYIRFTIRDTGCGMPLAIAPKIFDPFFTTKEKRSGSGLGLAVAHGIVAAHGGVITVLSTEGVGTTFQIYLRAGDRPAPLPGGGPVPDGVSEGAGRKGAERLLIVDDDVDVADGLSLNLARLGYATFTVYAPREALALFRNDPMAWDVVITDQVMPDIKGIELIAEMKRSRPGLRSILCSGFSANLTDEVIQTSGIDIYLPKPTPAAVVAAAIRRLMERPERPSNLL